MFHWPKIQIIPLWLCIIVFSIAFFQAAPDSALNSSHDPTPFKLQEYTFHPLPEYNDLETVCFRFSCNHIPVVHNLEGNKPRLYFDLHQVEDFDNPLQQETLGFLILKVRGFLHQKEHRLRIVVDLNPRYDYRVEQKYEPDTNTLCLVIQKQSSESR
jgi:hypothetical protein